VRWKTPAAIRCLTTVLSACAFVAVPGRAAAQYRLEAWTVDRGLPQNIVTAIQQTRDGYLWVATLDGLARFDGVRFTIFDKHNTPGISSNRFTALYQDQQGDLWLGTENSGVTRCHHGRFETWTADQGAPAGLIRGFAPDARSNVLAVSDDAITRWAPERGGFVATEMPHFIGGYQRLLFDERPGFWGRNEEGLHRLDGGLWKTIDASPGLQALKNPVMGEAQDGTGWLADSDGRVVRVAPGHLPSHGLASGADRMTYRDRQGTSWQIEVDRRLRRSLIVPTADGPQRVAFKVLFEDREGHLWLGTDGQGLYCVRRQVVTTYSVAQGLVDRNIYPLLEDDEGAVWIGAWEGGLSRVSRGVFTNYHPAQDGLLSSSVTSLGKSRDGRVWVATHNGLQVWHHGRFEAAGHDFLPPHTSVNVIHQDRDGAMWFGTGYGLVRVRDGVVTVLTTRDGLASDNIRAVIDRVAGGLWIASYGGLTLITGDRVTRWTTRDGLPGDMIRSLYEDADGVLWIGTYDSGLARFAHGRFTTFTTRDGLFNDGVFQILEDAQGRLWMSSNRGISRVSKAELNELAAGRRGQVNAVAYGKDDGLANVECNGGLWPAGIRSRDGRLWFPTQDGVAVIDPATITPNPQPPPVQIESVLVGGASAAIDVPLALGPGHEGLEITYTGVTFIDSSRVRFRYRLEGLDRGWTDAGTRRTAYYSHLPVGDFTFRVIAANSDGIWNTSGAGVRIIVTPPFYGRAWFWGTALTGLLIGAVIWHRRRLARLHAANAAQAEFSRRLMASQEGERQRIAGELHDSLGQQLLVITNRAMLGERVVGDPERAKKEFDEIIASAALAIDEIRAISYNLRPIHLDRLGLTASIEEMIERIASAGTIQLSADVEPLDGVLSKADEINCYRIVQESINNIIKHAGATKAYVEVFREHGELRITVRDNGRGFDEAATRQRPSTGLGLTSIAERAHMLGGALVIEAAPGQGTTLHVRAPLRRQPRDGEQAAEG
jgi:signal transduction histidine kinase/ligand-binding sensor domain-containing protein